MPGSVKILCTQGGCGKPAGDGECVTVRDMDGHVLGLGLAAVGCHRYMPHMFRSWRNGPRETPDSVLLCQEERTGT